MLLFREFVNLTTNFHMIQFTFKFSTSTCNHVASTMLHCFSAKHKKNNAKYFVIIDCLSLLTNCNFIQHKLTVTQQLQKTTSTKNKYELSACIMISTFHVNLIKINRNLIGLDEVFCDFFPI